VSVVTSKPAAIEPNGLSIGDVARQTGLAISAIRYYERLGLIGPVPRWGGKRRFGANATRRLRTIMIVQRAGFSLDEIRTLLDTDTRQVARRRLAVEKLSSVRDQIRELESVVSSLEAAISCGCNNLEHCALITGGADRDATRQPHGDAEGGHYA